MFFSPTTCPSAGFRAFFIFFVSFFLLPLSAEAQQRWNYIWGTDKGAYKRDHGKPVETLWTGGKVQKIIQFSKASSYDGWALLTDQGIYVSSDLKKWEQRNSGLPERVIKIFENGKKSIITTVQEIKDIAVDPENPELIVSAFKDAVYFSRNEGRDWQNLGMPNFRSNGIKAAAITSIAGELTIFCSHSIYGVYYINPDKAGSKWTELSAGLEKLETTNNSDEVSGFSVNVGGAGTEVYASQSFRRRLYKLDWQQKTWALLWSDEAEFGPTDSLFAGKNSIRLVSDGEILEIGYSSWKDGKQSSGLLQAVKKQDLTRLIKGLPGDKANCVILKENRANAESIQLSELWLLEAPAMEKRTANAAGKNGLYLPVNHAMDEYSLKRYLDIIKENNLNMVVIDMKDDYGRLRFTPQNPSITNYGRVFRPVDIDVFLKTMKDRGIFTVARLVVFKDPEAAKRSDGKYAVWDGANNKAWAGYYDTRRKKSAPGEEPEENPALVTAILAADDPDYEILRTWYDEKWVDPYSEEIWDYNASVAEELCRRGFDEIQFDYIRFPTDGVNLKDARFRWRDPGMDMDGAIISFLRHVRSRVPSPISVDIYGANGWYRTGARTGQEVEMLAPWVDVICPMYYPSHFEQIFLAHDPPELRPWRIYKHGTLRTGIIARGRIIVRPWAQAFYLNVSYDRKYYSTDYVRRQAEGVKAAGNGGLTYWNNSGRYDDIPKH